jgi:hypothetical protein
MRTDVSTSLVWLVVCGTGLGAACPLMPLLVSLLEGLVEVLEFRELVTAEMRDRISWIPKSALERLVKKESVS